MHMWGHPSTRVYLKVFFGILNGFHFEKVDVQIDSFCFDVLSNRRAFKNVGSASHHYIYMKI